jgi:aryl-alcohol dehydrogenase-like predicted oxidoreductase
MEKRTLGKTGLSVSALGFGGAEIGFEKAAVETVARLLGAALDAGLNVIDTAECYWAGSEETASEALIGAAVAHRRDDFHLFTKVGHASGLDGTDWSPELIEKSIDRSLKRLKTDRVELVQLHTCSEEQLRQGDVIAALQKARDAGKTRFIGYSGDSAAALYAVRSGAFDTLQTSVNIADQECIDLTLPVAAEHGLGVIAKRPIANVAWSSGETPPDNPYRTTYWQRLRQLDYDFLNADDAVATALRFTLSAPAVSTAIVGTAKPERWQSNARLLDGGPLPADTIARIRARWKEIAGDDWIGQA